MKAESITLPMNTASPLPADPGHERYSTPPFPAYRFVPGRFPHPRRDPNGHSFGTPEPRVDEFTATSWPGSGVYLYGVDLFNFAYWWECHEQWEAIWKFTAPESYEGKFLQGLVQIAAANLRQFMGSHDSGAALARKGLLRLRDFEDDVFLGIDVAPFIAAVEAQFKARDVPPPVIDLKFPACSIELAAPH